MFIYFQGMLDERAFNEVVRQQRLNPQDKNVVLIFPGNSSHHGVHHNLFTTKGGGGLGIPAGVLSSKGYPVLSLPTTSMGKWSTDRSQQLVVQGALEDLYRAVGAGFHLLLPVRNHEDTEYFDEGLATTGHTLEPSFWGENLKTPNKPLAHHYRTELDKLAEFIELPDEERLKVARSDTDNPLYAAYLDGLHMGANDPWLKKPIVPQSTPPETTDRKQREPRTYRRIDVGEEGSSDDTEELRRAVRHQRQVAHLVVVLQQRRSYLDMLVLGSLYTLGLASLAVAVLAFPVIAPALATAGYITTTQVSGAALTMSVAGAYAGYKFFQSANSSKDKSSERIQYPEFSPTVF